MEATALLLVGHVARPHGLKGECKVAPVSDDPARLLSLRRVWVGASPEAARQTTIVTARIQQGKGGMTVLARLGAAATSEEADRYRGLNVYALEADLPGLRPGEYFLDDLANLVVEAADGTVIGTLKHVWEAPGNNIFVVGRPGKSDAMIPAVPAFIRAVDMAERRVVITPIDGLLD